MDTEYVRMSSFMIVSSTSINTPSIFIVSGLASSNTEISSNGFKITGTSLTETTYRIKRVVSLRVLDS